MIPHIDPKSLTATNARASFGYLVDAIPKGKYQKVLNHAITVEASMNKAFMLLDNLRGYFLQTTGEESPFVKKIDELIPRQKENAANG